MNASLPFFNWSLNKRVELEQDSFQKTSVKILYFLVWLSLLKAAIVLAIAVQYRQDFQTLRSAVSIVLYALLLKLFLSNKISVKSMTHFLISTGVIITWSIIFISAHQVTIVTVQFVFMIILSSYYLLNNRWGTIYSTLAIGPIVLFLLLTESGNMHFLNTPDELAFPGRLAIIILNFVTFTGAHYLYQQAFTKNIEEKQNLNERLGNALSEAEKLAQSKSDFLSTMSHELRTPLNMVIGMTELLRESQQDKSQQENLQILSFSANNLHTLINDILDFNKLDSGKIELELIDVALYPLLEKICLGLQIQAREKGLKLTLDVEEDLKHIHVVTDPTRLTQVIYNLLGNGIKFTPAGEVKLSLVKESETPDHIRIRFSVKDTGIGINLDKHQTIFEPFTQASSNTTRNYGGTGLGLSIVKKLLELLNSNIGLNSQIGKGSEFYFSIDFSKSVSYVNEVKDVIEQTNALAGMQILAAEDNPLNAFLLRKLCDKWQVDLQIVENGLEAIQAFAQKQGYDVILMDLHMPQMDGYEASKVIRKSDPHIPIIALTASVSHDLESKLKDSGIGSYVRKPFSSVELYYKLSELNPRKSVA